MKTKEITIRVDGKKFKLPEVLPFGNSEFLARHYFYMADGFRCPKKGEFFVSGARPQAYEAPNNLSTKYLIVKKLARAKVEQIWVAVAE